MIDPYIFCQTMVLDHFGIYIYIYMVNLEDIFFHKGVMTSDPSLSSFFFFFFWLSVKGLIFIVLLGKLEEDIYIE